ncbi:hypothetical protein C8A00DRAFT_36860 [Chaetomidium leptoderma]|uniref:C2H2-type domain-containing protein n=1 Tax=Chaetomidium leptoderma TaxID=669021 RepID=A0AAN6VFH9_9PEZI|nr:hypothetical protein C8A00DRAFT_36860 [Chaetomidium leptoderma]
MPVYGYCQCTVTIDTYATNTAMRNFPVSSWDGIRDAISAVPLCHPFWRVDPDLGLRPWKGPESPVSPQAPITPAFDVPLIPISHWVNGSAPPQYFRRTSSTPLPAVQHHIGPAQDEIDGGFWGRRHPCTEPDCDIVLSSAEHLVRHVNTVHKNLKPYPCTEPGCGKRFRDANARTVHVDTVHKNLRPYPCTEPGCGKRYASAQGLAKRVGRKHEGGG